MNISQRGLDRIKSHEALRLFAYLDVAGVPTVGFGHTNGVQLGQRITPEQAEAFLRADLAWVERCIADNVRVPLTQSQYDALASLIFNIGAGAFRDSTLLRMLNAGDYEGAAEQFLRWNKARVNGVLKVVEGLTTRRAAERAMFKEPSEEPAEFQTTEPADTYVDPTVVIPEPSPPPATAPRPDQEPYTQEAPMPIPAIVGALLPELIGLIPKLGGLFGSGSKVSERNMATAGVVLDMATKVTGAVNAQEAIEKMKADPAALNTVAKAIESSWFDLTEGGGGGIDGARKADAVAMASEGPMWSFLRSPSFWMLVLSLPLVYIVVGSIAGLWGYEGWSDDVRASLSTAVVSLIIGGAAGYFWGQTTSRNRPQSASGDRT